MLARLHEEAQLLAELSDQAAAVTWLKDGHTLSPGPKYEVQASAGQRALLVRDVKREDAGLYECVSRGDRIAYQLLVQGDTTVCVCVPLPPQLWRSPEWQEPRSSVPVAGRGAALPSLWGGGSDGLGLPCGRSEVCWGVLGPPRGYSRGWDRVG